MYRYFWYFAFRIMICIDVPLPHHDTYYIDISRFVSIHVSKTFVIYHDVIDTFVCIDVGKYLCKTKYRFFFTHRYFQKYRYFLRQSVTGKSPIEESRRRTTTVPGARASPLRTCPGPLGGGTEREDLERPPQINHGTRVKNRTWNMKLIRPSQPGDQSDNNDILFSQEIWHICMYLSLLHILLRS